MQGRGVEWTKQQDENSGKYNKEKRVYATEITSRKGTGDTNGIHITAIKSIV